MMRGRETSTAPRTFAKVSVKCVEMIEVKLNLFSQFARGGELSRIS